MESVGAGRRILFNELDDDTVKVWSKHGGTVIYLQLVNLLGHRAKPPSCRAVMTAAPAPIFFAASTHCVAFTAVGCSSIGRE